MVRTLFITLLLSISLMMLTGCPGPGDRMVPDETSLASRKGEKVCIEIKDAQDYQPVAIAINLRGTPSKEKNIIFRPILLFLMESFAFPQLFIISLMAINILSSLYCVRARMIVNQEVLSLAWVLTIIKCTIFLCPVGSLQGHMARLRYLNSVQALKK